MCRLNLKIAIVLMIFFISTTWCFDNKLYAAGPEWIKDKSSGCSIWNPNPRPGESVKWSGKCVKGKAEGYGTVEWYQNGVRSTSTIYKENAGTLFREGRRVSEMLDGVFMKQIFKTCPQRIIDILPIAMAIEGGCQPGKNTKQGKCKEYQPAFRDTHQEKYESQYSKG